MYNVPARPHLADNIAIMNNSGRSQKVVVTRASGLSGVRGVIN